MLPIINILLIVGILLFILYNLYVDTRNWSNTGSFLEGMENSNSNYEYAQKRYCKTYDSYSRHTVPVSATQSKEKGCELKCDELGDNCNVMAAGDGTENGMSYNCTTYKNCALSAPGTSSGWTSGSGTTGGNFEYYKKIHRAAPATAATDSSPLAEYMGAKGGYDFSSADEAKAKCEADGLQLCKKEEVIAGAKSKDSLQNVCSTGWTTDAPRGWYSVKGASGCGSDNNWNTWAPPSGKGSAHCCKPLTSAAAAPAGSSEELKGQNDSGYRGNQTKTRSGKTCMNWTSQNPHSHSNTPEKKPNRGLGDHNYCRNPSEPVSSSDTIWCYTTDPNSRWEYCDPLQTTPTASEAQGEAGSTDVGAGTANDAMQNEINTRAGDVAPMGSNVPQNCKKGCVAPTGPNGNCKVIQKDGVEKRECDYGCPVPTFERGDTVNCKYDRDCNSCGTVLFNPDDPPQMPASGRPADGVNTNSWVGSRIDVPGIQNAPGLNPGGQMAQGQMIQGQMAQGQMAQGQMAQGQMIQGQMAQGGMTQPGSMEMSTMTYQSGSPATTAANVGASTYSLFNENIMKQVLANRDLIPSDINSNNEETSYNSRIGKKFMIDTATIRNFALPNIDEEDYIELGRIVKKIKMTEKDPQSIDQVKTLYSKLNQYVLELLTDSSLDMSGYDNRGTPSQINNKTRTTGMFGENSNSLIKEKVGKQRIKPYNSIWSLYH